MFPAKCGLPYLHADSNESLTGLHRAACNGANQFKARESRLRQKQRHRASGCKAHGKKPQNEKPNLAKLVLKSAHKMFFCRKLKFVFTFLYKMVPACTLGVSMDN